MAEGGGGGFNHNLWSQLNAAGGGGGGQGAKKEFNANQDDASQLIVSGAGDATNRAFKILSAIPILGWLIQTFLPSNLGEVSAFSGLEMDMSNKPINPGKGGVQGGVLAKIATELVSNKAITDHTEGVGGDASGGGGGGGGGGAGGDYSHHFESSFGGLDSGPIILAGGGNHFEHIHVPESMLGSLQPPETPFVGGRGMGAGMDLG